jgi:CDP-paratose 2-epimerase
MKTLITGGCGFLGSNLAADSLQKGDHVVVADALFRRGGESNLQWLKAQASDGQLVFEHLDLADAQAVDQLFAKNGPFDFICHVGGQVAMTTSLSDPRRDLLTNVVGTFNILEAMRRHSPGSFLAYSSTNKIYGDLENLRYGETEMRYTLPDYPLGLNEALPLDFSTPYGCSKGSADQYVRDWNRVYGLQTVVFRHSSIYGGRQFASYDQGWVGWFCQKALEQKLAVNAGKKPETFTISGTGKQVRDVLHAEDLVELYRKAYECKTRVAGQVFNIGGGMDNSLSLLELLDLLTSVNKMTKLEFSSIPRRQSDQDFFVADITKIKAAIGWQPTISSEDGIFRMVEWLSCQE